MYITNDIINNILTTILGFSDHNKYNEKYNEQIKAFLYGSSSYVYLLEQNELIIKKYNNIFRWTCLNHENADEVFNNELEIVKRLGDLIDYDENNKIIIIKYKGLSLYNNFILPIDWKDQIIKIFESLDSKKIYYPEFNLHNILVKNDKIHFIDYGLAKFNTNNDNNQNCKNFIEILNIINNRFTSNMFMNHILYKTLILNFKRENTYSNNIF